MCLILLAWQVHPAFPFVVAANRDEFFARRTAAANFWPDHPHVLAGRDLEAGGAWLGITLGGRFAALTNYRDPGAHKPSAPSRGRLVADYLIGNMSIDAYLDNLQPAAFNGFNLLLADRQRLVAFSNVSGLRHELTPGLYGLSNALLDSPWPKVGAGKTALESALNSLPDDRAIFQLLRDDDIHPDDTLPATGVTPEWERLLSAAFVRSPEYGTRCSTVIKVGVDGTASFEERNWLSGGNSDERKRYMLRIGCPEPLLSCHTKDN